MFFGHGGLFVSACSAGVTFVPRKGLSKEMIQDENSDLVCFFYGSICVCVGG